MKNKRSNPLPDELYLVTHFKTLQRSGYLKLGLRYRQFIRVLTSSKPETPPEAFPTYQAAAELVARTIEHAEKIAEAESLFNEHRQLKESDLKTGWEIIRVHGAPPPHPGNNTKRQKTLRQKAGRRPGRPPTAAAKK